MQRILALYALSGFVSLGYQVAWFRVYVDHFGSTNLTFALVLCNFIAGLGFGALASRPLAERLGRWARLDDRLRVYGLVELVVAVSILLTLVARFVPAAAWGAFPYTLSGEVHSQTTVYVVSKVLIGTVCVFVPCFFMGVTFPLLCHVFRADGRFPSRLYAWNTLGACSGVVASEFLFLPRLGHDAMLWTLAGVNALLGLYFLATGGERPATEAAEARARALPEAAGDAPAAAVDGPAPDAARFGVGVLLTCAILGGLLAGALEADLFKRIAFIGPQMNAAMSFVSFWAIVGIFLASWAVRSLHGLRLVHIKLAYLVGLAYSIGVWVYAYEIYFAVFSQDLTALLWFVGIFVLPPFLCVSLLLPYVCDRLQSGRRHLGLAYGLNTLAFCVGIVGFTWLAPAVSIFYSLKLSFVLFGVVAAFLWTVREDRRLPPWQPLAAVAALALGALLTPRGFDAGMVRPDLHAAKHPVRAMKSNATHTTYVVEVPGGDYLYFDNHPMSGTVGRAQVYMRLMAHFPLLAHPRPEKALLICFGVGNTASAIAAHRTIRQIDVVDLNDKVIETAPEFARYNRRVYDDPRLRFIHDDGRNYLRLTDERYDLITSEPPPPMYTGVYRLYSREYYEDALAHLTPSGLMTQWLPIYQMPREAVEMAAATFLEVFPHALLFTGYLEELILVGGREPIDLARIEERFYSSELALADLRRYHMRRPVSLFARIVQGDGMLREQFGDAPVISDKRNDLAYLFQDADDPPVVRYDPARMLADVGAERLQCYEELRREVTHLGRLTYRVPDFPPRSLNAVRVVAEEDVALEGLEWRGIMQLRTQAVIAMTQGQLPGARANLERILSFSDEQPGPLRELAQVLSRQGEHEAAIATLRRFLELEPGEVVGLLDLAEELLSSGRRNEAAEALRGALRIEPENRDALRLLQGLQTGGERE